MLIEFMKMNIFDDEQPEESIRMKLANISINSLSHILEDLLVRLLILYKVLHNLETLRYVYKLYGLTIYISTKPNHALEHMHYLKVVDCTFDSYQIFLSGVRKILKSTEGHTC